MNARVGAIVVRGTFWIVGTYAASMVIRFFSNAVLTRLITPDIFGAVLVVVTLRSGIELLTDVGIGQNVVNNKNGGKPAFYNTAWTIQIVRGALLSMIFFGLSGWLSGMYQVPQYSIEISAVCFLIFGISSTSVYLMQRHMMMARQNLFELSQDAIGAVITLTAASISPTLESILFAQVAGTCVRVISTYFLPESATKFHIDKQHAKEILLFGRWIYVWSLLSFVSASFDRLFLGQHASLAALGIYGLARTMADIPVALAGRLGHSLIFPLISDLGNDARETVREHVAKIRFRFLLAGALCIGPAIAFSDIAIELIYDHRYHDAGWMLPIMMFGGWMAILCSIGEYSLLGLGKPLYGASANCSKLIGLAVAMPFGFAMYGMAGAVIALMVSELVRYATILFGQFRERMQFFAQDLVATLILLAAFSAFTWLRGSLGLGTTFEGFPL